MRLTTRFRDWATSYDVYDTLNVPYASWLRPGMQALIEDNAKRKEVERRLVRLAMLIAYERARSEA